MRRRDVLTALAIATCPLTARGQNLKLPKVGVLVAGTPDPRPFLDTFQGRLRSLGYVDGRTMNLLIRSAEGRPERLDALASELVADGIDVLVGFQTPTVEAAVRATRDIPIAAEAGDLVGNGLVASLAHPGGNVTGVTGATAETGAKNLELLCQILPAAKRFGILCNVADPFSKPFLAHIQLAAARLNVKVVPLLAHGPAQMEAAFTDAAKATVDAVIVQPSLGAGPPAELALKLRLPAASPNSPFARNGGLLSYSADQTALFGKLAEFVDRILRGAKPAELPVELPTTYNFVINLKTAKALGVTVPPMLLAGADEVIE